MIRGLWTHAGTLYSVEDAKLYSIDSTGLKTERGILNSTAGVVDFDSNLTQLVINDGSYLYVYTPTIDAFAVASGYPGGARISFLDQRINFLFNGTQQFGWTALGTALTIDPLDFASAESSPDLLVSQVAFQQDLVLLGETSLEIFDTRGTEAVYTRTTAAIDYGCAAAHSAQKTANSLIWLGQDGRGRAQVISMRGHQPQRISHRAIEEKFEGLELSSARAFTYSDGGQSFYCLNVPGLTTTLVWDETFSQWHERADWRAGQYAQWSPTCHAFAYGKHFFGCGTVLATLNAAVHDYLGLPKRRQRIAPVISSPDHKRVFFSSFEVICEKGTGAQLLLRWSDDNGNNWSNWTYATVGELGQFDRRAKFNRLGSSFDRVFDLVMTDPKPFNPVQVNIPLQ